LFSSKTSITVHLNMSERENGQLPLAKRTIRSRISSERWEQIKTAYAAGIGLREIARKMKIPEGTVLAHAKRHGWTQQIQVATRELSVMQSDAIIQVQSVPQSIAAILDEHKKRSKFSLSKFTAEAAEQAAEHRDKLSIAGKVRDVAGVHKALWPEENQREQILDIALLTGQWHPQPIKPVSLAQTGEIVNDDQEEEERRRATQSQPLPTPDATNATNATISRSRAAGGVTAEDSSRLAYRERCMYWRRYTHAY
jgi:hypothetical protein